MAAYIVNLSTREYIIGENAVNQLKELLTPPVGKEALLGEDGESRWKRSDSIKFVSSVQLAAYIEKEFARIY